MPRTILLGRSWPRPGRPLFLDEDTDGLVALAEEERDTCPSCGMLKVWCRDTANQFAFDASETVCWATYRLEQHRNSDTWQKKDDAGRAATHPYAHFRKGSEPNLLAGLDLGADDVEDQH